MASSSSAAPFCPPAKHDVFLSFRGEDTRDNFTSHLYEALCRKKIETFIDDRLVRGGEIAPSLLKTIEESKISVIIFSKGYASSTWCLDELVKILDCRERYGRAVIPVFYYVDPSNVRKQSGDYADALLKHEQQFKDNMDKVLRWKAALTQAANISGWDSMKIRPESKLVDAIVKHVLQRLNRMSSSGLEGLVGMDKHIANVESLLNLELTDVRILGIWGIGGIGKTTIASAAFHKLASDFSSCTFIADVEKEMERGGLKHIQNKCLSELLGEEDSICGTSTVSNFSKERLQRSKVLLVLDNVNNPRHAKDIIGRRGWYGSRSRVIVTSRDKHVLEYAGADEIYEVRGMNFQDSLHLFCLKAFSENHPTEDYIELSKKFVNYAKGVPLAVSVLGSSLNSKGKEKWKSQLEKLEKYPHTEIFDVLKLSYDGLDDEEKHIFLDIACFYRGLNMKFVEQTLDSYGLSANIGMSVLIDRGLISIVKGETVMHDLIEEMGQEIVRQQSVKEPGKRSRLWKHEEIYEVLRRNTGTEAVQYIILNMSKLRKVRLNAATFQMMHNLILLHFYQSNPNEQSNVDISGGLDYLPDELRFLRWDKFPLGTWPLNFCPENLVKLNMRDSSLKQLWHGVQHLPKLKSIDLSGSLQLSEIPDLSQAPNIEEIILSYCLSLSKVKSSIFLGRLNCLWLDGCVRLEDVHLPSDILSRSSGVVELYNCSRLENFYISNMPKLPEYELLTHAFVHSPRYTFANSAPEGMPILEKFTHTFDPLDNGESDEPKDNTHLIKLKLLREGMPALFPSLDELCWLDLSNCESLIMLPFNICMLASLKRLYLGGCSSLTTFPKILKPMEKLTVLILDGTGIGELPSNLNLLIALEELSLRQCQNLWYIPSSIGCLRKLRKLDLTYCGYLDTLPSSIFELRLEKMDLRGCSKLENFPEIMEPTETFTHLYLMGTSIKALPASLIHLIGLRVLRMDNCKDLESVPNSICNLRHITELNFSGCESLSEIPSNIGYLSHLRQLTLRGSNISSLPASIANLSCLKSLELSDCKRLESIPEIPPFLQSLLALSCPSLKKVSRSRYILTSHSPDSAENFFEFQVTECHELDQSAYNNIVADAKHRILQDAYGSVLFSFPGNKIPNWFQYQSKGRSVTMDSPLDRPNGRFFGFALCVILENKHIIETSAYGGRISYRFKFSSYHAKHILPFHPRLRYTEQTFMWKYHLSESNCLSHMNFHAQSFTFEFDNNGGNFGFKVKECGMRPLYTQTKAEKKIEEHGGGDDDDAPFPAQKNKRIEC